MIRSIGTDPRKSVLMPRAISLRSRVLGNWQARFWRPGERGDPSAEFNQPQGDHLTGPEVRFGMFRDGVQLFIDLIKQRASIIAPATPFCFCTTQKHLTRKKAINSI